MQTAPTVAREIISLAFFNAPLELCLTLFHTDEKQDFGKIFYIRKSAVYLRKQKAKGANGRFYLVIENQNNNNLFVKRGPKMLRRVLYMTLTAALILPVAPLVRAEEDKTTKINQYVDQFLEIIPQGFELTRKLELIKDADLTFQKSLTVPVLDILDCKSKEELPQLLGIYIFDTNYAMLFDRRKEVTESWETVLRIALHGEFGVAMLPAADLKEMLDNPSNPQMRGKLISNIRMQVTDILKRAREKPEFLEVVVDEFYGTIVEGLYIVCKLALNEDLSGKKMVDLFNGLQQSLGGYAKIEGIFAGDESFEGMLKKGERAKVLDPINTLLKTNSGKLKVEDLKKILSIIEPIRKQVIRKCD